MSQVNAEEDVEDENNMHLANLKCPELPSQACVYALSVIGALIRTSQASAPLVEITTNASSHEFVRRMLPVSERTRTHFPLKKMERSVCMCMYICVYVHTEPREAQRGPERPREARRRPERPREAQRGPEKPREAQRNPGEFSWRRIRHNDSS